MRKKLFTHGTTFFMTVEMYTAVKQVTDSLEVGVSDFIRGLIEDYLQKNPLKSDTEVRDNENPDRPRYPVENFPCDTKKKSKV
jgi:hypothetical protein